MNVEAAPPSPILLEYDVEPDVVKRGRLWRWIALSAAFVGMTVTVLPFTYDVSPAHALIELTPKVFTNFDNIWLLAAPFFLAYPIFLWKMLRLLNALPRRFERVACTVIGLAATAIVMSSVVLLLSDNAERDGAIAAGCAVPMVFACVVFTTLVVRRRGRDERVVVAMIGPFVANLFLCLVGFAGSGQLGWYCSLSPAGVFLVEIILIARLAFRSSKRFAAPAMAAND